MSSVDAWDAHAPVYEKVFERSTWLWGRDALTLAGIVLPLSHPQRLLDVACGSGLLAITAAELGFNVTATDWSSGMIEQLRVKLEREEYNLHRHRISFRVVDGQTLDGLDDNSFDLVTSNFGIFLFPDRIAAWEAAARVLLPGGRILATSWDMASNNVGIVRYCMMYALNLPQEEEGKDIKTQVLTPSVNRTLVPSTFAEELEENGFRDVIVRTVRHDFCFTGAEELISGLLDNAAMATSFAKKSIESVKLTALHYIQLVLDGHSDPLSIPPSKEVITPCNGHFAMDSPLWNSPFAFSAIGHIAIGIVNK